MYNVRDIEFDNELVPEAVTNAWIAQLSRDMEEAVCFDYQSLYHLRFDRTTIPGVHERKLYFATAGAPCVGKSTELDLELARQIDPRYNNAVLIDPDRWVMEYMTHTYRPLLSAGAIAEYGVADAMMRAYTLARPGSNIIANLLLNEAFEEGRHIVHGTTLTTPHTADLLKKLGSEGYERRLMLCYSEEATRKDAAHHRMHVQGQYQVEASDLALKTRLFPQRMKDYFAHGDNLLLMWKDHATTEAVLAAEYTEGTMYVHDESAFDAFKNKYAADRAGLKKDGIFLLDWNDIETAYMNRQDWRQNSFDMAPKLHP